jgi:hypothetical protein
MELISNPSKARNTLVAHLILRISFVVLVASCVPSIICAVEAPVYQRDRDIAFVNAGYGGHGHHGGGRYGGSFGYGVPYGYPWFAPQVFAGTWYERPYPYHFDYYRMRYSSPPIQQIVPDCPCAEEVVQ